MPILEMVKRAAKLPAAESAIAKSKVKAKAKGKMRAIASMASGSADVGTHALYSQFQHLME